MQQAILEARERRWRTKQEFARRFRACVLSLCLNIPGPDKNPPGAEQAFALLQAALRKAHAWELRRVHTGRARSIPFSRRGSAGTKQQRVPLARLPRNPRPALKKIHSGWRPTITHETGGTSADGACLLMLSPLSAIRLKRMAVGLESEHPLGRLADIDVLTSAGVPVSRADLALPPRACFLCGESATLCRRRQNHSQELLMGFMRSLLDKAIVLQL